MCFRPFIIDLESTNSTFVNDEAIPTSRFYELKPSDGLSSFLLISAFISQGFLVLKFGQSTREYVLLHDEVS